MNRTGTNVWEAPLLVVALCAVLARADADEVTDRWKGHALSPPARVATAHGYPVYAFGSIDVYGVSPDFQPAAAMQVNNENRVTKVSPREVMGACR